MIKDKRIKTGILMAVALVVLVMTFSMASSCGKMIFATAPAPQIAPSESFAVIKIYGTIQGGNKGQARVGYDHGAITKYIDELISDDTNKGILLDVDSPGGTVYHSDELYLKLMEYKETTKRPIQAYFRSMAASGGYYIASSADYISANRNCWTGSIGVIISTTNLQGLYDKLGIKEVLITSGVNKGMGSAGSTLTQEQYDIYQGLVDDSYNTFVDIVSASRKMSVETVKTIADGRVYTANQAVANGLIDEICGYEEAVARMEEITGTKGYGKIMYTPSVFETYFAQISEAMPKSDAQAVQESVQDSLTGVPLYMYMPN